MMDTEVLKNVGRHFYSGVLLNEYHNYTSNLFYMCVCIYVRVCLEYQNKEFSHH